MENTDFTSNVTIKAHTPWFNFGPSMTVLIEANVELIELGEGEAAPCVTSYRILNEDGTQVNDNVAEALDADAEWNSTIVDRCMAQYYSGHGFTRNEDGWD